MILSKSYRKLLLLAAFLLGAAPSLWAMACPAHGTNPAESAPMAMRCCEKPANQVSVPCPASDVTAAESTCPCRVFPTSETSRNAVIPAPVPVMEVAVSVVLAEQHQRPSPQRFASGDPPGLHADVPVFLRLCTLLN